MRQVFRKIPVYTGDVSGVCSALFELGGMIVMHDPSGCNSTYNTHDEIRWYDHDSLIFISGLNEMEAIMGSDEDLIRDITESARIYSPKFIAIANSPIPYITGMDFDAISRIVEEETGIPAFYITTNGMHDYTRGAGLAFQQLAEKFVSSPVPDRAGDQLYRCNILGMTPLDFAAAKSLKSLRTKVEAAGFEITSCWAMGDDLETIRSSAGADVNLVAASSGFPAAQYMSRKFGIPFTAGFPAEGTEEIYFEAVRRAVKTGENQFPFRDRSVLSGDPAQASASGRKGSCLKNTVPVCFIGEPVLMTSLAAQVQLQTGAETHVFGATEGAEVFLGPEDAALSGEEELEEALGKLAMAKADTGQGKADTADHEDRENAVRLEAVADPYYRDVLPAGCKLISLPHLAFSGRILLHDIPDLFRLTIKC